MILFNSENEINKKFLTSFSKHNHEKLIVDYQQNNFLLNSEASDNKLFIIDLMATIPNIQFLNPELFAHELMTFSLPLTISDIYLLIESVNDLKMIAFAQQLAIVFSDEYKMKVIIHFLTRLGYDETLLALPENGIIWKIYGINMIKGKNQEHIQKDLIWEGENIISYLDNPDQIINKVSYA